ncbi:MAG: type II toxin-antitoxin system HicA family toxin [Nitrospirae bacterium]|nr:type II toxin-antitoxin system HicA family toxin [Nitrospirota bacterium]
MTGKELIKLLKENGWVLDRIKGSHHIMVKGNKTLSVPVHRSRDLPTGTLNSLLKEAGLK